MQHIIQIKNYIDGNTAISYEDGVICKKDMSVFLDKEESVILDFTNVDYVITAFLNPIIGDSILEYGEKVMKLIGIKNANEDIIKKIKLVKEGSLMKREDMEE